MEACANDKRGAPIAFLSHSWGNGGHTHAVVRRLAEGLRRAGVRPWLDEEQMYGDMLTRMCEGIDKADVFVVCVDCGPDGVDYPKKAYGAMNNVRREFDYAIHLGKPMIAAILHEHAKPTFAKPWPGPVGMLLGNHLYVDVSDPSKWDESLAQLSKLMQTVMRYPSRRWAVAFQRMRSLRREGDATAASNNSCREETCEPLPVPSRTAPLLIKRRSSAPPSMGSPEHRATSRKASPRKASPRKPSPRKPSPHRMRRWSSECGENVAVLQRIERVRTAFGCDASKGLICVDAVDHIAQQVLGKDSANAPMHVKLSKLERELGILHI